MRRDAAIRCHASALTRGAENLCLSDFIADRRDGATDYIGAFALTAGIGLQEPCDKFRSAGDDYSAIMAKLLADRLTEAFAEVVHSFVRRQMWGLSPPERRRRSRSSRGEYAAGAWPSAAHLARPLAQARSSICSPSNRTTRMQLTENWMISPGFDALQVVLLRCPLFLVGQIDAEHARLRRQRSLTQ